jgi:hypothetical protein
MKRINILVLVLATFTFTGYAGEPAEKSRGFTDKVTGEYTIADFYHRLHSAHEAFGKHPHKGFFFSWRDNGSWFEMDLSDAENTCVNVFADGQARIGGLVSNGSDFAPQIGRYFGLFMMDGGEPGVMVDHSFTYRVSTDYWSEDARLALLEWCETGDLQIFDDGESGPVVGPPIAVLNGAVVWPTRPVTHGNLQVHNSQRDGD